MLKIRFDWIGLEGKLLTATYKNGRDMNKWCVGVGNKGRGIGILDVESNEKNEKND